MGRSPVRKVQQPRTHRLRDTVIVVACAALVVFAVVGLISAGMFVHGLVKAGSPPIRRTPSSAAVAPLLAKARARATNIVRTARHEAIAHAKATESTAAARARHIMRKARQRATAIERDSRRHVSATPRNRSVARVTPLPTTAPRAYVAPTATSMPIPTSPPVSTASPLATSAPAGSHLPPPGPTPNFATLPQSWKVVAYGANLSAFTVTVSNRSGSTFSGQVTVTYIGSGGVTLGSAYAYFQDLHGGTTAVIPLRGERYPANAVTYRVQMSDVR